MPNADIRVPDSALERIKKCRFCDQEVIERLDFRASPYWFSLMKSRHIGIYRPNDRVCAWTARLLTKEKLYRQRQLGPALEDRTGRSISIEEAVRLAFEWFASPDVNSIKNDALPISRTDSVNFSPIGDRYTVGHALKDYTEWTKIARSSGGHYNNVVLINYHLVPNFSAIPLEHFNASHLAGLAKQVLNTEPRSGFEPYAKRISSDSKLDPDELRRRKRTFNSLVTILRMAFRLAWENGNIETERPWKCLNRISVNHSPRQLFLDRQECRRLLASATPSLRKLIQAALYTGCRVSELGNLRVEDVAQDVYGIRIEAFKRSPARYVFLPDEGMLFFLDNCEGKAPREYVFRSEKGKKWRKQHTGLFRQAVAKAGLPSELVFHGLRHTYASDLVRQGVSLDIVAKQLGHANTITVSNTYGHLAEHYREAQIRTRFSPLDQEKHSQASERREELKRVWERLQTSDWRSYGHIQLSSSQPKKSFARPHQSIVEVFEDAQIENSFEG